MRNTQNYELHRNWTDAGVGGNGAAGSLESIETEAMKIIENKACVLFGVEENGVRGKNVTNEPATTG